MASPSVAAVVVTCNRRVPLETCVRRLREQTHPPDAIVVVNNGSTDGTRAWLEAQSDLQVIHQDNLGGAGGFHNGLRHACERGYDLVWCMDDDVEPTPHALEHLMRARAGLAEPDRWVLNSLVVLPGDDDRLTWSMFVRDPSWRRPVGREYVSVTDVRQDYPDGVFPNYGCFFNATLVPRAIVAAIGLPRSEFFMKGDEAEYCLRVVRSFRLATVIASVVRHPLIQGRVPEWRYYLGARNLEVVNRQYFPCFRNSRAGLLLRLLRLSLQVIGRPSRARRMEWLGMWDALWGYFGRDVPALIRACDTQP